MTICRCRPCRLGIIGACVGAWLGINTAACYAHEAPEADAVPLAALSTMTLTTTNVSGVVIAHGIDRPAAMDCEPVRMPPIELPRLAAYDGPPPIVAWGPGWQRADAEAGGAGHT